MRNHAIRSIAVLPMLVLMALPTDARGGPYTDHAEMIWSSRDGLLRSHQSASTNPDVETSGERSNQFADPEPARSQGVLICEPFR
ncbi:MAG: hypothetical protein ACTHLO_01070 [Pseudolabrys sp.]